jgi:hypothetical protein
MVQCIGQSQGKYFVNTMKTVSKIALVVAVLTFAVHLGRGQYMRSGLSNNTLAEEQCTGNLRRIYELVELYLHGSGGEIGFPSNFDGLRLMAKDPNLFICPADKAIEGSQVSGSEQSSYEIVNNPLDSKLSSTDPAKIAIVVEKRPNHTGKRFALFYNGSIRSFNDSAFDRLKNNAFVATDK